MNWIGDTPLDDQVPTSWLRSVLLRSQCRQLFMVRQTAGAEVKLKEPEPGVSPGQACVMYDGDRLLGGGWIAGTEAPGPFNRYVALKAIQY